MERSAADLKSKASTTEQQRPIVEVKEDLKNLAVEPARDSQLSLKTSPHNDDPKRELPADDSFDDIERMCNKTLSDPNSPLYRFMQADQKKPNLNATPSPSQDGDLLKKLRDCTLLDEEEASSDSFTFFEMHGSFHLGKKLSQTFPGATCSSTSPYDFEKIDWEPISDKSFEAYERMYNKIISDPNSTLFKYVAADEREQILAAAKNLEKMSTSPDAKLKDDEFDMEFNDTMDELENLIKKVLEDMEVATMEAKSNAEKKQAENVLRTAAELSLNHSPKQRRTDTPKKEPSPFKVPFEKKKPTDTFTVKPFPKLNLFATPKTDTKKKQFSHVVSPIGAYMKKTATTPLITNMKLRHIDRNSKPSPFRNLDNESPSKPSTSHNSQLKLDASSYFTTLKRLPKKAYISSNVKRIVDERTPITVPGGQKIHKYLEHAAIPAVLKHEGHVNLPEEEELAASTEVCADSSIAELSVMTGDVSLYTAVDAQKF